MVKSIAIKKHMKVIENFLPDRPAPQAVEQADENQNMDVDEGGDSDSYDSDSDAEDDKPTVETYPSGRCGVTVCR